MCKEDTQSWQKACKHGEFAWPSGYLLLLSPAVTHLLPTSINSYDIKKMIGEKKFHIHGVL